MSKHTPGPWLIGRATIRSMTAEISAKRGVYTYTIAHVDCIDGGDTDACNMRLIAAAPALLDELERQRFSIGVLLAHASNTSSPEVQELLRQMLDGAKSAIAQAIDPYWVAP